MGSRNEMNDYFLGFGKKWYSTKLKVRKSEVILANLTENVERLELIEVRLVQFCCLHYRE